MTQQLLLSTRLAPPLEGKSLLARARLIDLAGEVTRHKLSVLQAPAGSGKTSLMAQWYQLLQQEGLPSGWLSIDQSGFTPVDLLAYLGAAIATAVPDFQTAVDAIVASRRHQSADVITTTLVNLLADAKKPVILFIDDLHFLAGDAMAQLGRFIEFAPHELGVVISSRTFVDLGLATARARGQLLEIGMDELRFTAEETRAYLESVGWNDAAPEALNILEESTDGWITGIKLASLALRDTASAEQVLQQFSGSRHDVSDYFAEQVLATLDDRVKDFLLKSALLERFCAALCDQVLQATDSREIIDQIETAGLFLVSLDQEREWYRFHPLFRNFLNRRLRDSGFNAEAELLLRASDWFFERESLQEAIDVALAGGNAERAAQILATCCQDWTYKGRISLVTQFVERIPREVLERYPTILLTHAWHLIRHLHFEQASRILDSVRERISNPDEVGIIGPDEIEPLRHQLLHREMTLAAARDDALLVEQKCKELLNSAKDDLHPYLTGSVYAQLLFASRDQFRFKEIESLAAKARGVLDRSGYDFALLAVLAVIGTSLTQMGKLDAATQALEEGINVAVRYGGERSPLVALAALPLSAILYERNQTKYAEEILARELSNATEWGLVDQFVTGYVTQIKILLSHAEEEEALAVLDEGMALALDRNLERLRLSLVAERLRLLSIRQTGSRAQVLQYGRTAGIPLAREAVVAKPGSRAIDELTALCWFRVALARHDFPDATHVARSWRRFCHASGAELAHVRWTIFLAEAQLLDGDSRTAQRTLREAIAAAAPLGMCRSFLDEGASIKTLLESCCQATAGSTHPADTYAIELLEAFGGKVPEKDVLSEDAVYGSLTDREIEVLLQVSSGMRNKEVAESMGMTEGSVKWYMQQIFDKLGTRSRVQAVERARKLGLIS
jgi:ATP/maltotriose-dependent transcriptional regulator MalT